LARQSHLIAVTNMKRRTFMIEPDVLEKLRAIKERTGLSESEQVRQGIRWWLESREWPPRKSGAGDGGSKIAAVPFKKRQADRE
jgi:hypothetical protein